MNEELIKAYQITSEDFIIDGNVEMYDFWQDKIVELIKEADEEK
jgi:hypothetical protein